MREESRIAMQARVLFALLMREMTTRYGRSAGGYVWAVLEPAGTLAMLSLVFSFIARRPALGDNFPIFFATGYMAFHFYMDISRAVSASVTANRALLTFPRVTIMDTIIARFLLQLVTLSFVTIVIFAALLAIFDDQIVIEFRSVFLAVALASFLGLSVGVLNSVLFTWSPTWKTTFGIVNRPLFLISGVFFTYEDMPRAVQDLLWWNPLIHVTAIMREGFYPIYDPAWVSVAYVIFFSAAPFLVGALLMRALRAKMLEQ
jgi:capsular polysaccharide transport system permease protein